MGTSPVFTTRIDARNDVTRVALCGELDMATVRILQDQLTALEQDGAKAIMLDLRELSFVDSMGLRAFMLAWRSSEQNGHRLTLVGATPNVRRLFEITQTEFLLDATGTADLLRRFAESELVTEGTQTASGVQSHA